MPLDTKAPRLIFQMGSSACALGSGDKSQITIVACASAAGFCLPPMVIWDHKTLAPDFSDHELALSEHWYDEGHDITNNDRSNTWLAQSHPTSPAASHVWMQPLQSTGISELLSYPEPPFRAPTLNPKSCGSF